MSSDAPQCHSEFVASWNDWEGAVCITLEDHERLLKASRSESGTTDRNAVLEETAQHFDKCAKATGDKLWESAAEQCRALKNAAPSQSERPLP